MMFAFGDSSSPSDAAAALLLRDALFVAREALRQLRTLTGRASVTLRDFEAGMPLTMRAYLRWRLMRSAAGGDRGAARQGATGTSIDQRSGPFDFGSAGAAPVAGDGGGYGDSGKENEDLNDVSDDDVDDVDDVDDDDEVDDDVDDDDDDITERAVASLEGTDVADVPVEADAACIPSDPWLAFQRRLRLLGSRSALFQADEYPLFVRCRKAFFLRGADCKTEFREAVAGAAASPQRGLREAATATDASGRGGDASETSLPAESTGSSQGESAAPAAEAAAGPVRLAQGALAAAAYVGFDRVAAIVEQAAMHPSAAEGVARDQEAVSERSALRQRFGAVRMLADAALPLAAYKAAVATEPSALAELRSAQLAKGRREAGVSRAAAAAWQAEEDHRASIGAAVAALEADAAAAAACGAAIVVPHDAADGQRVASAAAAPSAATATATAAAVAPIPQDASSCPAAGAALPEALPPPSSSRAAGGRRRRRPVSGMNGV
ncbi:hypothetical protein FNF28_05257 [Cafeteria roenbergensis]|nr:hypothetical protein FNF28_05257 [Cafeteria roenbergensis]